MLVLSRRLDEKILLPSVPALIKVISSHAGLVRLGIEAPSHVPILREELTHNERGLPFAPVEEADAPPGVLTDAVLRTRVNNLNLGLTLLRMQLVDCDPVVRKILDGIEEELEALRRCMQGAEADSESEYRTGVNLSAAC